MYLLPVLSCHPGDTSFQIQSELGGQGRVPACRGKNFELVSGEDE